jgi:hypothetical protein
MKKLRFIQIFSDGSLNYCNINNSKIIKKYNFCERDFKNSKFCNRKSPLFKTGIDNENLEFRRKFLKI